MKISKVQNPIFSTNSSQCATCSTCTIKGSRKKSHRDNIGTDVEQHSCTAKNVKKMLPSTQITSFSIPQYYTGKCSYVGFHCIDPSTGTVRRKRYKLEHIHGNKERKQYASILISKLLEKLLSGWTPWSKEPVLQTRYTFDEVSDKYIRTLKHDGETGTLRPASVKSYLSYLNVFKTWITISNSLVYIDQLSNGVCSAFLDYLMIDKGLSVKTRNHYLVWMGVFCRWLLNHQYVSSLPTEKLSLLREPETDKSRKLLSPQHLTDLRGYLEQRNPNYLLVCYLIYYCMIRPKELSMLKIGNIHLHDGVMHIPGTISKNRKSGNVTLPQKVIHLMVDLKIFDFPSEWYLFGEGFKPSEYHKGCKHMSDFWDYHIRRDLNWGKEMKLYSLKDTGITTLLHKVDALTVRDQARHSDLSITNIYAAREGKAVRDLQVWDDET